MLQARLANTEFLYALHNRRSHHMNVIRASEERIRCVKIVFLLSFMVSLRRIKNKIINTRSPGIFMRSFGYCSLFRRGVMCYLQNEALYSLYDSPLPSFIKLYVK